jgi:hypothetical protein
MPAYADISGQGGQGQGSSVPFWNSRDFLNMVPDAGYWRYLLDLGYGGTSPRARFAQNQQGRYLNMFHADAASDPNMGFYDWLLRRGIDPGAEFLAQSPEQRGDFTSRYLTPRARWSLGG